MGKRLSDDEVRRDERDAVGRRADRYGHVDDTARPREDYGTAERAEHAAAVARFRAANLEEAARYEEAVP